MTVRQTIDDIIEEVGTVDDAARQQIHSFIDDAPYVFATTGFYLGVGFAVMPMKAYALTWDLPWFMRIAASAVPYSGMVIAGMAGAAHLYHRARGRQDPVDTDRSLLGVTAVSGAFGYLPMVLWKKGVRDRTARRILFQSFLRYVKDNRVLKYVSPLISRYERDSDEILDARPDMLERLVESEKNPLVYVHQLRQRLPTYIN